MIEALQAGYERNRIKSGLPENLRELKYLYQRAEATEYYRRVVEWMAEAKNKITYRIPITAENIEIDLLDRVQFSHNVITQGREIIGYVTGVEYIDSEIELEITTEPVDPIPLIRYIDEQLEEMGTIDEEQTEDKLIDEETE